MTWTGRLPGAAAAVLVLAAPATAKPQDPSFVLVSLAECCPELAWPEAEKLVADELGTLDFEVAVVGSEAVDEPGRRGELVALALSHGATGAVQVVKLEAGGAELWVVDLVTGKTSIRTLTVEALDPAVAALRVVELFRASLLEIHVTEPSALPPAPVVEMTSVVAPATPPGRAGILVGLSVLGSAAGAGAHGALEWAVAFSALPRLELQLEGMVTFAGENVTAGGAGSSLDAAAVRAWVLFDILDHGTVRPAIGAGGGLLVAWARGRWSAAGEAALDIVVTGHAGATAQLALALSRSVWLRAGFVVGFALPRIRVLMPGGVGAVLGLPLLEGWLCMEVRLG